MDFEQVLNGVKNGEALYIAMAVVVALIVIVGIFAAGVSIYLMVSYVKYNRRKNSAGISGNDAARKLLDQNGLNHIKVSTFGSIIFGNSYSHYFNKVRLRRLTAKKESISSLAMASQKTGLAVLDKENDKDMKTRVRLTPLIYFGPFAFIPLIAIGVIIDIITLNTLGIGTLITTILGLALYVISFILSIKVLQTEKKAQAKAIEMLKENNLATDEEIAMMQDLFRLYNIEYINNIIIALLEMILRVLQIIAEAQAKNSGND